jgi:hypothetical protein
MGFQPDDNNGTFKLVSNISNENLYKQPLTKTTIFNDTLARLELGSLYIPLVLDISSKSIDFHKTIILPSTQHIYADTIIVDTNTTQTLYNKTFISINNINNN